MKFTWDENKRLSVLEDHKVDFVKVIEIFNDPFIVEYLDVPHSTDEDIRVSAIGITPAYGLVFLVYTEPSDDEIRFITARKAERWMVTVYDKSRIRS